MVCGADVRLLLLEAGLPPEQVRATVWGIVVEVGGVRVRPVECHHWSHGTLASGAPVTGTPLAFIVETEPGVRIYHYGDTAIFDMGLIGRLYRPTVGLIGCTDPAEIDDEQAAGRLLTGELSPDEAALVAEMLGVELAVACHYLGRNEDVDAFLEAVPRHDAGGRRAALAPEVGDTILIDGAPREATVAAGAPAPLGPRSQQRHPRSSPDAHRPVRQRRPDRRRRPARRRRVHTGYPDTLRVHRGR